MRISDWSSDVCSSDLHGHDSHAQGDIDPHAWQSLRNGMIYARNIADGLVQADPTHRAYYRARAKLYIDRMAKLDAEIRIALEGIPANRRTVITSRSEEHTSELQSLIRI